jgi:hypothetical protein
MATSTQVAAVLDVQAERTAQRAVGWPFAKTPAAQKALAITVALRVIYSLLGFLFAPSLRLDPKLIQSNSLTGDLLSREVHPVLYGLFGVWERFDTLWYIRIAHHGYDSPMASVFYPLYPALIRALSVATRFDLASALLISTASSFFLFWGALRLFEMDYPEAVSLRAILLWVAWPASFTFFAAYPDSLLCALVVWSIYFARRNRWMPAGALGLLAGSTKALGCLTALPLLWMAWKQRKPGGVAASFLCGAGAACFQGWLAIRHFPTAAQTYAMFWHTSTVAPWTSLIDVAKGLLHGGDFLLILNAGVLVLAGAFALLPEVRVEYRIFAAAAICLFLTKHTQPLLQSTTRYSLAIFAAYPSLAARVSGLPLALLAMFAAGLNLLFFRIFLDWGLVV